MRTRRIRGLQGTAVMALVVGVGVLAAMPNPSAQAPLRGQSVTPAYEGFWPREDGTIDLWFGYYNRNWEEELDLPIGPDNHMEPGGPDLGQPTHFFPRRNQFVFKVNVPGDFGDNEIVWSLTGNGETWKAYGSLRPEYTVDATVMMANFGAGTLTGFHPDMIGNEAPVVTLEVPEKMTVSAGEPVTLAAVALDDGKPAPRPVQYFAVGQSHFAPDSATGLRLSWFRYRGPGEVVFDPPQTKVWMDHRDGARSPWSVGWETPPVPPDNTFRTTATFSEPGTYVLRALGHDGGLLDYKDVTVTVTR